MKYLTPSQCRAARGLLDWSQPDLSKKSGVHVQTICAFEHETGTPTRTTLEKITDAFEKGGAQFTKQGVEYNESPTFFIEGNTHENTYLQLLEDVFQTLKNTKNPELLLMYADDKVSPLSVNEKYREMRSHGVKMRQLIKEGNTHIIGPLNEYRYIPKKFFINRVTLIYGNRIANETSSVLKACVRVDPINADLQRNTFNMLWSILDKPTKTTASERF